MKMPQERGYGGEYSMTEPLCTCGKRPKHKCCEESGVGGKMCLRGEPEPKPNNLSVEDSFDIMFGRYQHALEELSEK